MNLDNILPFSLLKNDSDYIRFKKDVTIIFKQKYSAAFLKENNVINGLIEAIQETLFLIRQSFLRELQDDSAATKQLEIYKWIANLYRESDLFNDNSYNTLLAIAKDVCSFSTKAFDKEIKIVTKGYSKALNITNAKVAESIKHIIDSCDSNSVRTQILHDLNNDVFDLKIKHPKEKELILINEALISTLDLQLRYPLKNTTKEKKNFNHTLESLLKESAPQLVKEIHSFIHNAQVLNTQNGKWEKHLGLASMLFSRLNGKGLIHCSELQFKKVLNTEYGFEGEIKARHIYTRLENIYGDRLSAIFKSKSSENS